MKNNLLPERARIISKTKENDLIYSFRLQFPRARQKTFDYVAGQYLMLGVPGFGEGPFTVSSDPRFSHEYFDVCIRSVGDLTKKINSLSVGDYLYVRGPYGNGFPEVKQNLIIVGGGCGFIPLKAVILENLNRTDIKMQTFLGCRNRGSLVFERELGSWRKKFDLQVILEESSLPGFSPTGGFVTDLLKKSSLVDDAVVFMCGPEVMYKFVAEALIARGVKPENLYLSLERRMACGSGVCQHCAIGPKYVCKDGPVFTYPFLKSLMAEEIKL